VRIDLPFEQYGQAIRDIGIGFLFAQAAHTATRHAAPARKLIGERTVFNLLGPLTNPAGAQSQVLGVFSESVMDLVINICAQCHNHRGASWTSSNRPPHHSPQYNMLLGTVGLLSSGWRKPTGFARVANQKTMCGLSYADNQLRQRVPTRSHRPWLRSQIIRDLPLLSSAARAIGPIHCQRDFQPSPNHQGRIRRLGNDQGAGAIAHQLWQPSVGIHQPGRPVGWRPGPGSSEQALVPVNIQKARFNLYLVLYDGSYGVHNGPFAVTLLDTAQTWVEEELNK